MYFVQFILILNVINVIFGKSVNFGRASVSTKKLPLKIVGSDDEVLQPFFELDNNYSKLEKNNFKTDRISNSEFSFSSPTKMKSSSSSFISSSGSSSMTKGSKQSESGHFKMNLDLPTININNNNNLKVQSPKPSENILSAPSATLKAAFSDALQKINFNNPFEIDKDIIDIDIVLFSPNSTIRNNAVPMNPPTTILPGTVIVSHPLIHEKENNNIAPGTVINAPKESELKVKVPVSTDVFSSFKSLPILKIIQNERNTAPSLTQPTKPSIIRSLERPEIENLVFDQLYAGPKITIDSSVTTDFVYKILIPYFKSEKLLDRKSSYSVRKRYN